MVDAGAKTKMLELTTEVEEAVLAGEVAKLVVLVVGPEGQHRIHQCTGSPLESVGLLQTSLAVMMQHVLGAR